MSKEAIIKAFEGVNVRIVWDDQEEEYFFSVNDIVEVTRLGLLDCWLLELQV